MQRKSLFWFLVCLLCLGGAMYSWHLGDQWQAEKNAVRRAAQESTDSHKTSVTPHAFAPAATSTNGMVALSAAGIAEAKKKNPYPYRLTNTTESVQQLIHNDKAILLANALLDTSKPLDLAAIPERLHAPANSGSYIVQSRGALDDNFRAALRDANATIISYIPNNAYLVRVSDSGAQQLSANPQTQSVLAYQPYYKLDTALLQLAMEQPTETPPNGVKLTVFPDAYQSTKASLEQMGAIVVGEDQSPFGPVIAVEPAEGTLSAVASLPGVQLVAGLHRRVHANDLMRPTIGAAADNLTTANYMGLHGNNVLVNINDEGVDATHPDLAGRLTSDSAGNLVDTSGHGTHVAGSILGNGGESTTVTPVPPGSATNDEPNAGPFVFRGVADNANGFVMSFSEPDSYLQETAARKNLTTGSKMLISNNSWNYIGDASYDIAAASYDAAVRDALPEATGSQPILYVFAAGNSGGAAPDGTAGDADSILSPATAKNVITVGAVEQARGITNAAVVNGVTNFPFIGDTDSSDQVAEFSSRGNVGLAVEGTAGRFKPDLVAPGTYVISDRSSQWDQNAYYNPTNDTVTFLPNRNVTTNALNLLPPIFIEDNDVRIEVIISTNRFSPHPMPPIPIYAVINNNVVNPTTNNFIGTNAVVFPTNGLVLIPFDTLRIGIGNITNPPINFDVTIHVFSTNTTGFYVALSNLNNSLGTNAAQAYYRYESGTSMAAASVSGMLACLQEFFNQHSSFQTYSPALMKALLINGANPLDDYDLEVNTGLNSQGWGVPSLTNTLPLAFTNFTAATRNMMPVLFVDQNLTNVLATGQSNAWNVALTPDGQDQDLRITLVWTDPPGNPVAGTKLVNDLDLIVSNNVTGDIYYGNDIPAGSIYNELGDTNSPTIDSVNNVENVFLQEPVDTNFTIIVIARRVNVNAVTANTNGIVQDFALVVSSVAGIGQPPVVTPFTNFVPVTTTIAIPTANDVTNLIVASNGVPLFNQRVGANSQFSGSTNGTLSQWNFYVYTNTAKTDPTLANAASFTNLAFVTFAPPGLGVPRMEASGELVSPDTGVTRFAGADVDMYVSTNGGLTNLDPTILATAFVSATRTGTEKVLITDAPSDVYYIAIKSEDQQGAQYDFLATAINQPFDQTDTNGDTLVTMLTPFPVVIPPGGPSNPNHALILGVTTAQQTIRKVLVTNIVAHQEFGDLIGTLTHESAKPASAVLNNHSFFSNLNNLTNQFVYDDSGENEVTGSRTSDGPGTLRGFTGDQASEGIWRFVMVNDSSLTDTGAVVNFVIKLEPEPPIGPQFTVKLQPNSFFYFFADVPVAATNMVIAVSPQNTSESVDLYVREGDFPTQSLFDFFTVINPPGGTLTIDKFSTPPLNADRYYIGIFNPNADVVTVNVSVAFGISVTPEGPGLFTSVGNEPIADDAVTYSTNFVNADSQVVSTEVGVRIEHPRESDLVLTLISPSGTRVLLAENRGGLDTNGYGQGMNITNVLPMTASGMGNASTNIIGLTNTFGTLLIQYDFHQQADDLRVYYEGTRIYDSTLISGSGTISVDFGPGNSTNIEILMNESGTNPDTNGDLWNYTASVITKDVSYAVFSEDPGLAKVPIKFALPPFGSGASGVGASNILTSGFEGSAATTYLAGATVDGWTVQSNVVGLATSNTVRVVTVPQFADSGSNVLALHDGTITRMLPTVAGRSYTLTFASHGRPALSPVSWYKGEGGGGDSADGNDGMLENGASATAAGEVGQAFSFNGINQYLLVPDAQNLHFRTNLTAETWIFPTDISGNHAILTKLDGHTINQTAYGMELSPSGQAYFELNHTGADDASSQGATAETPGPVPINQWTHLAATYDGASLKLYMNGTLMDNQPYNLSIFDSGDVFALGANAGGQDIGLDLSGFPAPFKGLIDEATVYSNPLTISQVQDIYAAGSAGKCPTGGCTVSATVTLGGNTRVITGIDKWEQNTFTFTAPSANTVLTITPNTNFDGTVQNGLLVDTFKLLQNPIPNPTNYFLPEESLEKLVGEPARGNWKLEILDNRVGATNPTPSLVSWQLSLQLTDKIPASSPLVHAVPQTNTVAAHSILYYAVDVPLWAQFASNIVSVQSGSINLLFSQVTPPTGTNVGDITLLNNVTSSNRAVLSSNTVPPLMDGKRYYLGVQNTGAAAVPFVIEVDFDITTLSNNVPITSSIAPLDIPRYFQFDILSNSVSAGFDILNQTGSLEMVVKKGAPLPDASTFDYVRTAPTYDIAVTTNTAPVPLGPGRWYVGVFNTDIVPVTYTIVASQVPLQTIIVLTNDERYTNTAPPGAVQSTYYEFTITQTNSAALFELYSLNGNVDLTLQRGSLPAAPPFFDSSTNGGTTNEQIVIRTNVLGTNINGNWFLGVPNNTAGNVNYVIHAVVSTNGMLPTQVPLIPRIMIPPVGSPFGPTLVIPTVQGDTYEIQSAPTPVGPWTTIATILASGETTTYTAPNPGSSSLFYRVIHISGP